MFDTEFLTSETEDHYRRAIAAAAAMVCSALPDRSYSGLSAEHLRAILPIDVPATETAIDDVLQRSSAIVANSVTLTHPNAAAHFHCAPLISALAAEVIISVLNQSMDSFDQAPAATVLEQQMMRWLCNKAGLPPSADGTFTSGGTQSNFMGLLLARDAFMQRDFHWSVRQQGLPPEAMRIRILCSDVAHFTIEKSAWQLGLGTDAVVKVASDASFRMRGHSLASAIRELRLSGLEPMAVVATAGSTDYGSVDPLHEIAEVCRSQKIWLHVDAAYGGALFFSHQKRSLLRGIEEANSLSMDFHKLFWQPITCSAFLLQDAAYFRYIEQHSDYLNPKNHDELGIPDLIKYSLSTTRRFDALKLWISLNVLGLDKFGSMIDRTFELAARVADTIRHDRHLELLHEPQMGCVVFRYRPESSCDSDTINANLRYTLFQRGIAVIGHTRVHTRQYLKLTCMNPTVGEKHYRALIAEIVRCGEEIESGAASP